jgi:hypothetical protein
MEYFYTYYNMATVWDLDCMTDSFNIDKACMTAAAVVANM